MKQKTFLISGFIASLFLAGIVSFYASSHPDGLEKVAEDIGFIETAKENINSGGILADYGVKGAAGVIGVIATGAVSTGIFALIRRKSGVKNKTSNT